MAGLRRVPAVPVPLLGTNSDREVLHTAAPQQRIQMSVLHLRVPWENPSGLRGRKKMFKKHSRQGRKLSLFS